MTAAAGWTDRVAAPLDDVRRTVVAFAVRNRSVRALVSSRDRRLSWILGTHAFVALALTTLLPAPLLVFVPLILGVPHVVADVRYLILRRIARPRVRALALGACAALAGVNALALLGARVDLPKSEVAAGSLALAAVTIAALAEVRRVHRPVARVRALVILGTVLSFGCVALKAPRTTLVVMLHAHNWVALVVWLWIFRRRLRGVLAPLVLIVVGAGILISGILTIPTLRFGVWNAFGTNLLAAADWLAPGVPGVLGVGLASSFVFLQSVHYLVWLVLLPMEENAASGFVSFKRCFRRLRTDLGLFGIVAAALAWALVVGFGVRAPLATRNAYLALASFHVWLELAALAFFAAAGRQPVAPISGRATSTALRR